jgi:pimeloyl-ACP methyl ester carboxylesterase
LHYLEYKNRNNAQPHRFDALYLQHGFGASSLSWLPAIPSLVDRLNARVGLGHDTVGFGFTDRPKETIWYTKKQSARIAHQLLKETLDENDSTTSSSAATTAPPPKAIALMGHSMGCLSILRLATQLPKETSKFIVLSSPALGINNRKKPQPLSPPGVTPTDQKNRGSSLGRFAQQRMLLPIGKYMLRRIVGTNGSWKSGLKFAWGDPDAVTDGDVLRFSWPAIGEHWEEGILTFASAQGLPQEDELDDDRTLMRRVLDLPNTTVVIVLGSKDKVVPARLVYKFMETFDRKDTVPIVELEGLGHDAFEEDTETFCDTVDRLLESHWNEK